MIELIELIKTLFTRHEHHWEIIQKINYDDKNNIPVKLEYVLQCSGCGNLKSKSFSTL